MKILGSWKELLSLVFRKDTREITLRPNQSTTYTADRDMQLPPGDTAHVLTSATSSQTLTNKTIDGDDNTVQDLPVTALKTALADADKVIVRDASGVPTSALLVNANVSATAAISATKIGNGDVDNTELSKLNGLSGNITTDTNTQTLTNKTIDGDDNTLSDIGIASLKTVLADADKVLRRDGSGVVVSGNSLPNSSTIVTTDATQTLTGKTIDASSNTVTNVSLSTGVTDTLPITSGGTGQTSQTAAFNALDPLTTKGDLIVHNGTDSIRLGVGTNGQVLIADSAASAGVKWDTNTPVAGQHYIISNTPNGYGSTDQRIRRYDSSSTVGTAITYTDSSTAGASYTINEDGIYAIEMTEQGGTVANAIFGISLNANGSADLDTLTAAEYLTGTHVVGSGFAYSCTATIALVNGDVVKPHVVGVGGGRPNSTSVRSHFKIYQVAKF